MAEPNVLQPLGAGSRLPLGLQVTLGVGSLLLLVALCVLIAVVLLLGLRDDQSRLSDHSVPYANAVAEAALSANAIATDERGYLITGDREFVAQLEARVPAVRTAFEDARLAADGSAQRKAVWDARAGFEDWITVLRAQIERYAAGARKAAVASALGPGREMRRRYEVSLAHAQSLGERAIESGSHSVDDASSRSVTILLVCLLLALLLGIGLTLWLLRTILSPVQTLLRLFGDLPQSPTAHHEAR